MNTPDMIAFLNRKSRHQATLASQATTSEAAFIHEDEAKRFAECAAQLAAIPMSSCVQCGTTKPIQNHTLVCGAPQCCPVCCQVTSLEDQVHRLSTQLTTATALLVKVVPHVRQAGGLYAGAKRSEMRDNARDILTRIREATKGKT